VLGGKLLDINEILSGIEADAEQIVGAIGQEAIDVYGFLCAEFARGPATKNYVFQFVYRSFYRLDNAGLRDDFKAKYFELMEKSRNLTNIDISGMAMELFPILNRRNQKSLQFSFVTKLANTINSEYPIYDAYLAKAFNFHPSFDKDCSVRLDRYQRFYDSLQHSYKLIRSQGLLKRSREIFRRIYSGASQTIPETKVLDFIFWSYGRRLSEEAKPVPDDVGVPTD
jgi:hypothetical protein